MLVWGMHHMQCPYQPSSEAGPGWAVPEPACRAGPAGNRMQAVPHTAPLRYMQCMWLVQLYMCWPCSDWPSNPHVAYTAEWVWYACFRCTGTQDVFMSFQASPLNCNSSYSFDIMQTCNSLKLDKVIILAWSSMRFKGTLLIYLFGKSDTEDS